MSLFLKDKAKNIFLHKDSKFAHEDDSYVDVILSPEFYWIREFSIPVKTEKEALKFLPSFFEDIVDDKGYKYFTVKIEEEMFLSLAYSEEYIKEAIKQSGLNISSVMNIYFSQFELKNFKNFAIEGKVFSYQNNILVKVPTNITVETKELQGLEDIELSNRKIKLDLSPKWLNSKTLYNVCFLLLLVAGINFVKAYSYENEISKFEEEKNMLKHKYKLPSSTIQLRSIVKNSLKENKKKDKIKQMLVYLLEYKKDSSVKFTSITYSLKKIEIKLTTKNNMQVKNFERYINKKYKTTTNQDKFDYLLRIVL